MDSIYILKSYRESKREKQEGDDRGWDAWTASPTRWTWVWVNSGSWWWTGRPGMLRFMRSQRVGHDWATELNWTEVKGWDKTTWQRNRMGRPLSPPQIHLKIIWMLSDFHKTTSERWQRTPGTQKGSPFSLKGGRTKYKRQKERQKN